MSSRTERTVEYEDGRYGEVELPPLYMLDAVFPSQADL